MSASSFIPEGSVPSGALNVQPSPTKNVGAERTDSPSGNDHFLRSIRAERRKNDDGTPESTRARQDHSQPVAGGSETERDATVAVDNRATTSETDAARSQPSPQPLGEVPKVDTSQFNRLLTGPETESLPVAVEIVPPDAQRVSVEHAQFHAEIDPSILIACYACEQPPEGLVIMPNVEDSPNTSTTGGNFSNEVISFVGNTQPTDAPSEDLAQLLSISQTEVVEQPPGVRHSFANNVESTTPADASNGELTHSEGPDDVIQGLFYQSDDPAPEVLMVEQPSEQRALEQLPQTPAESIVSGTTNPVAESALASPVKPAMQTTGVETPKKSLGPANADNVETDLPVSEAASGQIPPVLIDSATPLTLGQPASQSTHVTEVGAAQASQERVESANLKLESLPAAVERSAPEPVPVDNPHVAKSVTANKVETVSRPEPTAQVAQMVEQVATAVNKAAGNGQVLRIRLNPPELGVLQVEVVQNENGLSARLETESAHTQRLIKESIAALKESLQLQGHSIERIDVQLQQRSAGDDQQRQQTESQHSHENRDDNRNSHQRDRRNDSAEPQPGDDRNLVHDTNNHRESDELNIHV